MDILHCYHRHKDHPTKTFTTEYDRALKLSQRYLKYETKSGKEPKLRNKWEKEFEEIAIFCGHCIHLRKLAAAKAFCEQMDKRIMGVINECEYRTDMSTETIAHEKKMMRLEMNRMKIEMDRLKNWADKTKAMDL